MHPSCAEFLPTTLVSVVAVVVATRCFSGHGGNGVVHQRGSARGAEA